ncbi:competence/damage-inducible protein A [Alkalilimnicola ehrlichii]|uniref:Competence/damage-inducible protein A n=1 Tax=Alkalilimnicola ehrlichii TaxID=351052 RepID=A0A3E0X2V3_9GAMM|nr:molybdopterin-binding protein [Alkalilimnicola ehrlichii]RFA25141.1 competence/damage-inducible protein A [Alkalilimnicola ehrlichii]RFA38806.1 competence/damage-inducible protein A [Alkalilimnicola ehrlichii]
MTENASSATPVVGAIVIGDEILSGKRSDKHIAKLIALLAARGMELSWVRILGDDAELLTQNLRESFASGSIVFSFGGIGATPDDRTRQCAAAALGLPLEAHPDGLRALEEQFGPAARPQRVRMVEFPQGAEIIPNPVNRVPGFSIRDHHFVPGFPNMAWPMVEWVLDNRYPHLQAAGERTEQAITVFDCRESQVIDLLETFEREYPMLRVSCLPHAEQGFQVELGLRGEITTVNTAMKRLQAHIDSMGFAWERVDLSRG